MTPKQVQANQDSSNARYIMGAAEYAAILRRSNELKLLANALLNQGDKTAYAFITMVCDSLENTVKNNCKKDEGFIQDCYDLAVNTFLNETPDINKVRGLKDRIEKMFPFIRVTTE